MYFRQTMVHHTLSAGMTIARYFRDSMRSRAMRAAVAIFFAFGVVVSGVQAEPTTSQKQAFLDTVKQAIGRNDARLLDPLIYAHGMSPDLFREHQKSMDHLIEMLSANQRDLDYQWEDPPPG